MVAVVTLAASSGVTGTNGAAPELVNGFYGTTAPPGFPAVDFALRDQDGKLIRLRKYAGKVVLLTFVYSTCQNTCPIVVGQIRNALTELPRPIPALAISVDPKQDTPSNVSAFLIKEDVNGELEYLVGSRQTLAPIWKQFGIQPQVHINSSKSDHSIDVVLLDKTGRARVAYNDVTQMDPDSIAHDIRALEAEPLPRVLPRRREL